MKSLKILVHLILHFWLGPVFVDVGAGPIPEFETNQTHFLSSVSDSFKGTKSWSLKPIQLINRSLELFVCRRSSKRVHRLRWHCERIRGSCDAASAHAYSAPFQNKTLHPQHPGRDPRWHINNLAVACSNTWKTQGSLHPFTVKRRCHGTQSLDCDEAMITDEWRAGWLGMVVKTRRQMFTATDSATPRRWGGGEFFFFFFLPRCLHLMWCCRAERSCSQVWTWKGEWHQSAAWSRR